MMQCPYCGQEMNPGAKFCINCGTKLEQPAQEPVAPAEPVAEPTPTSWEPAVEEPAVVEPEEAAWKPAAEEPKEAAWEPETPAEESVSAEPEAAQGWESENVSRESVPAPEAEPSCSGYGYEQPSYQQEPAAPQEEQQTDWGSSGQTPSYGSYWQSGLSEPAGPSGPSDGKKKLPIWALVVGGVVVVVAIILLLLVRSLTREVSGADRGGKTQSAVVTQDITGTYEAVGCSRDGIDYDCEGDGLTLESGGSGTICYNGREFSISWSLDGEKFTFTDQFGETVQGTYRDGTITGNYDGYDYVFEGSAVASNKGQNANGGGKKLVNAGGEEPMEEAAEAAKEIPEEPALDDPDDFTYEDEDVYTDDYGLTETDCSGYYYAVYCEKDENTYVTDGEFVELDRDGTGSMNFNYLDLDITSWFAMDYSEDGEDSVLLFFTDEDGDEFYGVYTEMDGVRMLVGDYFGYTYIYCDDPSYFDMDIPVHE